MSDHVVVRVAPCMKREGWCLGCLGNGTRAVGQPRPVERLKLSEWPQNDDLNWREVT